MTGNKLDENPFLLGNSMESTGFSNRMNAVFGNLSSLEVHHEEWQRQNRSENRRYLKLDPIMEDNIRSRPTQETFKRPSHGQISMKRSYPSNAHGGSFKRDPNKWKRYTLADVSDQDMSEKSNTAAAMSFIAQRKRQKLGTEQTEQFKKPVFSKPQKNKDVGLVGIESIDVENPICCSSKDLEGITIIEHGNSVGKIVMPEYVVGQKRNNPTKKNLVVNEKLGTKRCTNSISLNHLEEEEEDEQNAEMETDQNPI